LLQGQRQSVERSRARRRLDQKMGSRRPFIPAARRGPSPAGRRVRGQGSL
jgi:hypothetical protein